MALTYAVPDQALQHTVQCGVGTRLCTVTTHAAMAARAAEVVDRNGQCTTLQQLESEGSGEMGEWCAQQPSIHEGWRMQDNAESSAARIMPPVAYQAYQAY
jgi:hypothetical protein